MTAQGATPEPFVDGHSVGERVGSAVRSARRLLPSARDYEGLSESWRVDVVAGVTVGVVALPLALAFGIAAGLGATAGLVTAIVAGLVAAVFGGSSVQVSGPTGAMAVVLAPVGVRFGTKAVFLVGVIAGVLIVVASLVRLGRYLTFVPWPVIEGFTVGIAVIIFLQQVPSALGVAKPRGQNNAAVAARAVFASVGGGQVAAVGLVVVVAAVMMFAPRLHRSLPASLIAVVIATGIAQLGGMNVARIGVLPAGLPVPSFPFLSNAPMSELFSAAFAVAVLAALESLLSAKVADGMTDGSPHDPDRELFGQGLANLVAPMFGGMPATGAIARTAVNVRAGARTRVAAIVHSLVLIAVIYLAGPLVAKIPIAALSGVLMVTAVRMVDIHNVRSVLRSTRGDAVVLALTAAATVAFDLIVAVEIGIGAAAVLALRNVARTANATPQAIPSVLPAMFSRPSGMIDSHDEVDPSVEAELLSERIIAYRLDGALFFGAAQRFLTELTAVSDVRVVILRFPQLQVLDATGAQALGEIVAQLEHRGVTVLLKGPRPEHLRVLQAVGALDRLAHENHLFDDFDAAVIHARNHLARLPNGHVDPHGSTPVGPTAPSPHRDSTSRRPTSIPAT